MYVATVPIDWATRKYPEPKSERSWLETKMEIAPSPTRGIHWYVVHCAGVLDEILIATVKKLGWPVLIPSCMELRAVPKRRLTASQRNNPFPVKRPQRVAMFPRYPFLQFDLRDPLRHEVFALLGVQGMICDGSGNRPHPAYVHDEVINKFQAKETGGTIPLGTTVRQLFYKAGEEVRITSGPFSGMNATVDELPDVPIERLDETARLGLLVHVFGQMTPVELSLADIEKL